MREPWRLVRLRFWESGRAGQTPTALLWEEGWLEVRLVSESRVEGPRPGGSTERRFAVEDQKGSRYEVRGRGDSWRGRKLDRPDGP